LATLLFVGIVSLLYFFAPNAPTADSERISLTQVLFAFLTALAITLPICFLLLQLAKRRTLAELGEPTADFVAPRLGEMTSVAIPLMFVHLLVFFTMNADLWILEAFCDLEKVGLYAAARRLMLAVSIPCQIAAQATMSSIPDLAIRRQLPALEQLLRRSALISAVVAFAIGGVLLAMPEFILATVCDAEYAAAAPILVVLCLGNLVVALCGNAIHALIMTGRHFYGLVVYAIAAVVLAVGGPLAAQAYGAIGVATVASSCLALQNVASWWLAKRYVGVWTHPGWPTAERSEPVGSSLPVDIETSASA
jgi:O-antigen/teichoic acid export membrane protein